MRNALLFAIGLAALPAAPTAFANEKYEFPSVSGSTIAASAPAAFVASMGPVDSKKAMTFAMPILASAKGAEFPPFTFVPPGGRARGADAHGYRFVTHGLSYAAFSHYANDYYRLFAPGHAVDTWTDRVSGYVDMGYGGAIDGWTVATYYLPARRGPRRDSAPDLSLMPALRAHPELQQTPAFKSN